MISTFLLEYSCILEKITAIDYKMVVLTQGWSFVAPFNMKLHRLHWCSSCHQPMPPLLWPHLSSPSKGEGQWALFLHPFTWMVTRNILLLLNQWSLNIVQYTKLWWNSFKKTKMQFPLQPHSVSVAINFAKCMKLLTNGVSQGVKLGCFHLN